MATKLIAIVHDGDCSDCSYTPLEVPVELDVKQAEVEYRAWWAGVVGPTRYVSLADYLIEHKDARRPEIEEFEY